MSSISKAYCMLVRLYRSVLNRMNLLGVKDAKRIVSNFAVPEFSPVGLEQLESKLMMSADLALNTLSTPYSMDEDGTYGLSNLAVTDTVDDSYSLDLSTTNGVLYNPQTSSSSSSITISDDCLADINSVLDNVTFSPTANYNGTATISFTLTDDSSNTDSGTVSITVNSVNDAPVAVDNESSFDENTSGTYTVLLNDYDVDNDTLTITSVTQGSHGSVVNNGDGTITYTPETDFYGDDTFTYAISDGNGGTDTATVTAHVLSTNTPPVAVDNEGTTDEDTAKTFTVLLNDYDVNSDPLTITSITQGSNGTVVDNGDGTLTYTPETDFIGDDTFTYTIADGQGGSDTATVTVHIVSINDAPVAVNDASTINEDTAVTYSVLLNDTDVEDDTLTVTSVTQGSNGTVVNNGDGTVTYTPNANYNGVDTFTYTISDGNGGTDTATVTTTVTAVNDAPVAVDNEASLDENTSITYTVLLNDSDVDDDTLTITSVTQGSNGTVVNNGDGTITYTPDTDYYGDDTFTYTISDGNGGTDTATVTAHVLSTNTPPVAVDNAGTTDEDTSKTFTVLANDYDVNSDPLTIVSFTQGSNGTVANNGDGTLTYTPDANFFGSDSFIYTINDGQGGSDTATVSVTVTPVDDAPIAVDNSSTINEDSQATYTVLLNDIEVDGDTLTITAVTQGSNGTVVNNGDGTITYTPDANYFGIDSFTYTISDGYSTDTATVTTTVTSVNDAPVAADESSTIDEDGEVTYSVLLNDTDIENDTLTITAVTQGANGTVVINGDDTITYTPDANFFGVDSFTYTVSDGQGGSDTATVTTTMTAVDDAPIAVDNLSTIDEDGVATYTVLLNDIEVDGDTLTIIAVTQASNGSVVNNGDGTITYTPDANYYGVDSFTYTISDGISTDTATVTTTVTSVNDAPVALDNLSTIDEDGQATYTVLLNDSDVEDDALTIISVTQAANGTVVNNGDGTITYTPDANYYGVDSFTYTISDGNGGTATATVTTTVTAVNDAPVALDNSATIDEDGVATYTVLLNDSDVDDDTLTITSVTQASNGTVVNNGDGTITYTPDANYYGVDSFTYTISDGNGGTDTATVTTTVTSVNDAPVALDNSATIDMNNEITFTVLLNDSDVENDTLSIQSFTQASNGTVTLIGTDRLKYVPATGFTGIDTFTYVVSDGNGGTDAATVTVTVQ